VGVEEGAHVTNVDLPLFKLAVARRAKLTRLLTEDCLSADRTAERGAADLAKDIKDDIMV
jgi:hypothetical protein